MNDEPAAAGGPVEGGPVEGRPVQGGPDELLVRFERMLDDLGACGDPELWRTCAAAFERARAATEKGDAVKGDAGEGAAIDPEQPLVRHGMIGQCPAMVEVFDAIDKFAATSAPVLILGESGTGKDLVARAIHAASDRSEAKMIAENCAAIPESLLESTLFGHVRGAFTGAVRDHAGHFVAADGGTLFLDEIGDMPLPMQAKLLRALQEGEVRPVGANAVRQVDVRILAATNAHLEQAVADGRFREDLFYRLNVLRIRIPPLRDRGADAVHIARKLLRGSVGDRLRWSSAAERVLASADWPGNIRQLQNEVQRLAALCDGPEIVPGDLSPGLAPGS